MYDILGKKGVFRYGNREKASEMLEKCNEIILASVSENGYPRACVISRIKSEGIRKIGRHRIVIGKVRHFKDVPKQAHVFTGMGTV